MLNKTKYKDEILEIACSGDTLAVNKHTEKPENCSKLDCTDCLFDLYSACGEMCWDWRNSEYREHEVDWNKVSVDTPVYVKMGGVDEPRYFAKYEDNHIFHFGGGKTSFTNGNSALMVVSKDYIKLARPEDIEKYSK